jgi:FKBP-type peptidyl-prolyl cis-trans isomerase 2
MEFTLGDGMLIPGFENAVVGMEKGEEKQIMLEPAEAYGDHNPQLVKKIPRDQLPKDRDIKPGMLLGVTLKTGQQIPALIREVGEKEITVDLNHPLAGKKLKFKITLLE